MSTIQNADYKTYGFTIRACKNNRADYSPFFTLIAKFSDQVKLQCKFEEYGKHDWKHYHGIIAIKKRFYRKRLEVKDFHIKLEEIYDIEGWTKYITKEGNLDDEIQAVYDAMGDLIQRDKEIDFDSSEEYIEDDPQVKKFRGSVFKKHRDKQLEILKE